MINNKIIDEEDLAYAAGFIDGEGCLSVGKTWKIAISCSNTDKPTIKWLHKNFGGSYYSSKRKRKPNHRTMHTWQIVSLNAYNFCKMIVPYLKIKTEQALLLIAIQQTMTKGGKIPPEILKEREYLNSKVK